MAKGIGLLLLFAGIAGGYLVLTGKFPPGSSATPTSTDSKGNPIVEKTLTPAKAGAANPIVHGASGDFVGSTGGFNGNPGVSGASGGF
jgi:hypothetical protein